MRSSSLSFLKNEFNNIFYLLPRGSAKKREGLDLPEVSLVAILDVDKEGFLRSQNKIEKRSLVSEATEQIRNYILKNDLQTLPVEAELGSRLGISRSVVREALSRLQHIGLVESRRKKGIMVRKTDPIKVFKECLPFIIKSPDTLKDIISFRYILEQGAIQLVVEHGSREAVDKISEAALAYKTKAERKLSHRAMHLADEKFHISILEATGNKFLLNFCSAIAKHFEYHGLAPHRDGHHEEVAKMHLKMADAIGDKNTQKAQRLVKKHLKLS